jgi:hypothetical protein
MPGGFGDAPFSSFGGDGNSGFTFKFGWFDFSQINNFEI